MSDAAVRDRGARDRAREYYDARVRTHGPTPAGADWNSQASQELRFRQLARLWEGDPEASVLDYGCGYGALAAWLRREGHAGAYVGFDISERMVEEGRRVVAGLPGCAITTDRGTLGAADFAVASGVLNVRQDVDGDRWAAYVLDVVDDLASLGTRGFAFNALTIHSDPDRRRGDLHYADPLALFEHCRRTYARTVALLHDYPLYEFTILVRR